jgi:DNA-binding MarR family transcriptional regulator
MEKFTLLMQLFQADEQGLRPSECAERVRVTKATVTELLDELERDGWVRHQLYPFKSHSRFDQSFDPIYFS